MQILLKTSESKSRERKREKNRETRSVFAQSAAASLPPRGGKKGGEKEKAREGTRLVLSRRCFYQSMQNPTHVSVVLMQLFGARKPDITNSLISSNSGRSETFQSARNHEADPIY